MKKRRVVITGIGMVTPIGVGIESFWRAAAAGVSGTKTLRSFPLGFPVDTFKSQVAAVVPDEWLHPTCQSLPPFRESRHFLLGSAACSLTCEDAGVADFRGTRSAVVLGNAIGGTAAL